MIPSYEVLRPQAAYSRAVWTHFKLISLCLFSLLPAFHCNSFAQDTSDIDVVRVRTDLVTVPAYVTDKKGQRVANLISADFELRDDGRVVKVEYFAAGTERVALVFALDASGSIREIIGRQRHTALALFERFGHNSAVAVMRFADTAELVAPFSNQPGNALSAFDLPPLVNHPTAIFDGVASAIRAFDKHMKDAAQRRIIIVISDGLDTASATPASKVIDTAIEYGVSIYAIQIPLYAPRDGRLRPRPASKGFRELAEKTGGRYFMAGDPRSALETQIQYDLSPVFQAIEEDLRGQYVFGYYPEENEQDGRFHTLELNLASSSYRKLRAHLLRKGYMSKR